MSPIFFNRFACCQVWILLLLLGLLVPVQAAEIPEFDALPEMQVTLERLDEQLASAETATEQELKTLGKEIAMIRSSARDCVQEAERVLEKLDSELAILHPVKPADEQEVKESQPSKELGTPVSPEIAQQLEDLQTRKASLKRRITTCKLLLLRSKEMESTLKQYLRNRQAQQLLVRGPTLVDVVQDNMDSPERWFEFTNQLAVKSTGWDEIPRGHLAGATAVGLLGLILGLIVPRRLRARIAPRKVDEDEVSAGLLQAGIACSVSFGPVLFALGGISAYLTLIPHQGSDLPLVVNLIYGLLALFLIAAGIRTLLNPCPPATYYLPLPEAIATPLGWRSRILVLIVATWWLVKELKADDLLDETMFMLARQIIALVWVLNTIWLIWLLRRLEGWRDKWALPLLLNLALLGGLVAVWIGFLNLGDLVIRGITHTLLLIGLALVLVQFFADLFDGLDEGRYRWQQTLRRAIGLKGDEYVPGLGWLRLFINLALWIGVALLVLNIWGAGEVIDDILRYFTEGIQVAGLAIVPGQLLWAILALAVLLTFTRWFKARLNTRWLTKTRMEPSAREALVTTFGYVAVAVSVVVALSIAGITFTNLAIIAGALSVGIGFGLQNVVNNFVSGIIMLVERPVRTGDWIVVGNTEGHVKRISIRTTSIQTFDRAEVIVPNSDLISGQVTNWTLRNRWGRIRVPIGVSYGSDTGLVKETLLEIAHQHADIIKGDSLLPDPLVLFLGFGNSSLDFELRAIIRDVNQRFRVISDINFDIDNAFRKQGVEIPFPQRDLNFRGPLQVKRDAKGADDASDD